MTELVIKVGRTYAAKRLSVVGFPPLVNDRQVIWMDSLGIELQYDSPTVGIGRKYPRVSVESFAKWAKEDVTDQMPKGEWRSAK